jgi:hypothetical protein
MKPEILIDRLARRFVTNGNNFSASARVADPDWPVINGRLNLELRHHSPLINSTEMPFALQTDIPEEPNLVPDANRNTNC